MSTEKKKKKEKDVGHPNHVPVRERELVVTPSVPKVSVPPPVTPPPSSSFNKYLIGIMVVLMAIVVMALIGTNMAIEREKVFQPTPIIPYQIRKDCLEISPEEIVHLHHDPSWQQAHSSLVHWMHNLTRMEGITAFHVGNPYCYVLLRQSDKSLLGLFNLKFMGYHKTTVVTRNEVSLACKDKIKSVDRAQTIYVEYLDDQQGQLVLRKFNHTQAFVLQTTGFYLKGLSTCDDSDKGIKTLEQFIKHPQY